jgi:hypothetical protein
MKLIRSIKKWFKNNRKSVLFIILTFSFWRVGLIFLAWLGQKLIPLRTGFLGGEAGPYWANPLLWSWANFDGVHYLSIAQRGYYQFQQAFFPLYPYLIRNLQPFFQNYLYPGLLVSHLSLLIALFLFYELVKLDYDKKIAHRTLLYLLIFPTAFFFVSVYTESLFLALVLGSFYAARKKNWWIAGILGGLASATRFVGIFLFPALLIEWFLQNENAKKRGLKTLIWQSLPLFFITTGLLFYMAYLKETTGDFLYFFHVQPFFGAGRSGERLILLYQVFWRYLKMLITVQKNTPTYFVVVLESLTAISFLIFTIFAYLRRWFAYVTFMALAFITPTLTGTFLSLPRFALTLFPGFILLAIWGEKYRWVRILYPVIAIPLLILSVILFTRGYFVA